MQIELLTGIIKKTTNQGLIGYLINEYRACITNILRSTAEKDMILLATPFLNIKQVRRILEVAIKEPNVSGSPEQTELISCGLSLLLYLSSKFVSAQKANASREQQMISEKTQNVLDSGCKQFWLNYFAIADKIKEKTEFEISAVRAVVSEYTEEQQKSNQHMFMKENQLFIINGILDRLHDVKEQLKSL